MTTILIVEDNPANMKLAALLLEKEGHAVLRAEDGETGVRLALEQRPDLVLMDIQLPGMDGLEATRRIKQARAAVPVLALTALAMSGDRERIVAAGCDGYIAKPIRYREFLAAVSAALDGASGATSGEPSEK